MEAGEQNVAHVPPDGGRTLWVLGDLYRFIAASEDTDGAFALVETTTPPENPGPPPHIHHQEDETFYLLEGQLELLVNDRTTTVSAGSFVRIPKGTLHTFRNVGTEPARFLAMVVPGGFEKFWEEVGEPATDPSSPPAGPPDVEKVMAAAPRYGLEIPPPPEQ
jgi:mannose-6-phosphate isomerase-like protein (cupin superfamily)